MPWVNREMCTGCGTCVDECPAGAIALREEGRAVIDEVACIRCGTCHDICPEDAVRHDSERIPRLVEANLQWARDLMARYGTDGERVALLKRLGKYFRMQGKVADRTLDGMEELFEEARAAAPPRA